jgi:hypothetical protein
MPTLFKRSNGIFYIVTDGKNGRRRWISTGERTRSRALNHFKTQDEKPEVVQRSKRLSCFVREFLSSVSMRTLFVISSLQLATSHSSQLVVCRIADA